jgi:hypothetical protein
LNFCTYIQPGGSRVSSETTLDKGQNISILLQSVIR